MDLFKRYWTQARAHLGALTISQRLLIGLLVVIMLGTVFFSVLFSARRNWVDLVAQPLSKRQIARIQQHLAGVYPYKVQGDEILVPADKLYNIQGDLAAQRALPHDMTTAFARLASSNTIFNTGRTNSRLWNFAREQVLAKVIGHFPYLRSATVLVSRGQTAGLGSPEVPSSATVSVTTRDGRPLNESQVLSIVEAVQGAVSGLKRQDVHVTDGQHAYQAPSSDEAMPTDLLEFKTAMENNLRQKLLEQLSYLGDAKISVNVVPDMAARTIQRRTYNPKGVVSGDTQETTRTRKREDLPRQGGQPGVQPNVSATATPAGGGGARHKSSVNNSTTQSEVRFDRTLEAKTEAPGTQMKSITASISVPRSYFVSVYRQRSGSAKANPHDSDPKFMAMMTNIIGRIRLQAMNAIGATVPQQVQVDWFDDTIPPDILYAGAKSKLASRTMVSGLVVHYGKQALLGGIALAALGVMFMMVRRSAPVVGGLDAGPASLVDAAVARRAGTVNDPLVVGDDSIGEAGEGDAPLTGIELDDETLNSRKIVEEVATMIKENPESAASLVKRWMTKGK